MKFKQFISTNFVLPPPNNTLEGKISFEEVNYTYTQEVTGKNNLRTAYQLSGKKAYHQNKIIVIVK